MQRENGFLNLDKYFEKLKRENNLSDIDMFLDDYVVLSDYCTEHYWLKINGEYFYFKNTPDLYEELIASECARYLGIPSVSYDLAIFNGKEGVISKSYQRDDCNYVSGTRVLSDYASDKNNRIYLEQMGYSYDELMQLRKELKAEYINVLEIIWQAIEYRYRDSKLKVNYENIMHNLISQFCLNILIGQYDAFPQNREIEERKSEVNLVPYFDGGWAFRNFKKELPFQSMSVGFHDKGLNNFQILETFLRVSSNEFVSTFISQFDILNEDAFKQIIVQVENKIGAKIPSLTKERIINSFVDNRNAILEVLATRKMG